MKRISKLIVTMKRYKNKDSKDDIRHEYSVDIPVNRRFAHMGAVFVEAKSGKKSC